MTSTDICALVTGGARRIGRAIVEDLAANGFAVAIHCQKSRREADALAADLRARHGRAARVTVVQADLTDAGQSASLIDRVTDTLAPPRIVVNNASLFEDDRADALDMEIWERHFDVHLKAPAIIGERLCQTLPTGQDALIVNIIDQRVWRLTPRFFSYTLSKSALWTATRTMAQALAPRIRVNAIGPGPTLPNARQTPADFDRQTKALPLKHAPHLEEFGATVRYFWQARSVTGQMIALDGGQHLAWETPDVAGVPE